MGWLRFDIENYEEHEGYVVGVVRDGDFGWRDLRYGDVAQDLTTVQIGCDCGWRSPRLTAPLGTTWQPCTVVFRAFLGVTEATYEEAAADIWNAHLDGLCTDHARQLVRAAEQLHKELTELWVPSAG